MRVLRVANQYLEVDILPDFGGHVWGAKDLVSGREMFHRTDAIKPQHLGVAGPWIATGIEFNFPVTHSILTIAPVNSTYGVEPDGAAWVKIGATDKLFGMQWQMTIRLRPESRAIEIDGWLHNPTDFEHPYCYWGNAGATTHKSLRLYYPFKYSEHHGGKLFKWPFDDKQDLSYWKSCKQPISAFGDTGDKRYMGGYYEKFKFGLVHTSDPKTVPGKKYFAWGDGPAGKRWGKLLSDKLPDYVEIQSGTRNDQEFWSTLEPHSTIAFHERWQAIDGLGGITDANELVTVWVGQERGKAVVRAQPTEPLSGVEFRAFTTEKSGTEREIERWTADLAPDEVHTKKLNFKGPVRLDVNTGKPGMALHTCDFSLFDYGPAPQTREEVRDPSEVSSTNYREIARHAAQVFHWSHASVMYDAALKLSPNDQSLKEEVGLFRLHQYDYAEARKLLREIFATGARNKTLLWGLLRTAWATQDSALEQTLLAAIKDDPLAHVLSHLKRKQPAEAVKAGGNDLATLCRNRDLGVAVLVARRLAGTPDTKLLAALFERYPLDPIVCFEKNAASIDPLLETDRDIGITIADIYLGYGDAETALRAIEHTAKVSGEWKLGDCVLANHCAKLLGRSSENLSKAVDFDPLNERPWQDSYLTALPEAIAAHPGDSRLQYVWGNLLQRYGRKQEATAAWRKSLSNGGDWPQLHLSLALVDSDRNGCSDETLERLATAAAKINNHSVDSYYFDALRHSGRRDVLLKEFAARLKRKDCDPSMTIAYSLELVAHEKYDEALDYMLRTKHTAMHGGGQLTRAHIRSRIALARRHFKAGKVNDARKELKQCFVVQHNFSEDTQILNCLAEVYCLLAEVETAQGKSGKAAEWYAKAANEFHDLHSYLRIWQTLGMAKSGKAAEAAETFKRIERLIDSRLALPLDDHSHYYHLQHHLALSRGDEAGAKAAFEKAFRSGMLGFAW
jgi:tetratricopeptide (TPR) repeat protein